MKVRDTGYRVGRNSRSMGWGGTVTPKGNRKQVAYARLGRLDSGLNLGFESQTHRCVQLSDHDSAYAPLMSV